MESRRSDPLNLWAGFLTFHFSIIVFNIARLQTVMGRGGGGLQGVMGEKELFTHLPTSHIFSATSTLVSEGRSQGVMGAAGGSVSP